MTRYSVQSRDQIFVKAYGFLSFSKNIAKSIGEITKRNLGNKYIIYYILYLIIYTMHFKLLQKKQFKNQKKHLVILLIIELLIKLQKSQEIHKIVV